MKNFFGALMIFLMTSSFARAEVTTCPSSYEAIYKPHPKQKDYDQYEMTISQKTSEEVPLGYEVVKVIKSNAEKKPVYELSFNYLCSEGSAHHCTLNASTNSGKSLVIEPQALNSDLSPAFFIARGNEWEKDSAPYTLILSNSISTFHYLGPHISEENLKYFTDDKEPIYSFPTVWLLSACKNNDQGI